MKITVLRGIGRIGENLIEIQEGKSKILLECGVPLSETKEGKRAEERVLQTEYDGAVITHYHADHCGLLKKPLKAKEIYMGKTTMSVLLHDDGICAENIPKIRPMENEKIFKVGELTVKPYLCDHSAYDSYMTELRGKTEIVFYTGDFRSNGRKSFSALLARLPQEVDTLIYEGTNMGRTSVCQTERELEEIAVKEGKAVGKIFVLQSRLNMDRTVTFYRVAKRLGRTFLQSLSSARVCELADKIPSPVAYGDCYTYLSHGVGKEERDSLIPKYSRKIKSQRQIAKTKKIVMQVHGGMLGYFQSLAKYCDLSDSVLYYSLWQGYKEELRPFLEGISALGITVKDLHTSGHADALAIDLLKKRLQPKREILVHSKWQEYSP